jgi:prolyl oligopeptidase
MKTPLLIAALVAATVTAVAQDKPAPAPIRPVTDTYHGDTVADPYRWLEDYQSPEAKAWIAAQDAWARKQLSALPAREHYRKRLAELEAIPFESVGAWGPTTPMPMLDGSLFYVKRKPGEQQPKLYHRASGKAAERMLFDPAAGRDAKAPPRAIAWYMPSPDGKHVAIGVAEGGSERADLWVLNVATGKMIDGPISRADAAQPSWTPDGKGFFYTRLAAGRSEADRYNDQQARWHALGATGEDPIVFGNAYASTKHIDKLHWPNVFVDPAGELLYGYVSPGTERRYALYVGTMKALRAGKIDWKPVFDFDAGYEVQQPDDYPPLALRDGKLPLFTRKGNPDGSVVLLDPLKPNEAPKVLYAARDRPITYYALAKDGFYVRLQDGPVARVVRIDTRTGAATPIALPVEGAATFAHSNPAADGLVMLASSWSTPSEWQYIAKGATKSEPLPLADASALRALAAALQSEVVMVDGHDGVKVPMSVIYAKGFKKDGTAPAYVSGYAGYGLVDTPGFSRNYLALAERGFVIAVCHARGSGAYGERWHKAGYKATKPNTWKDMISCAEWLAKNNYASAKRIAGTGGSAGGVLIGRAVTERPDVFAAAVIRVGALDQLRFEQTANGKANISEFGTVKKPDEYRWLKAMSTYHAITDGAKYPALLLTHGFNDPRVPVWMTTKATARFQAASASGKPVYARVDMDAGHGIGSSTAQRDLETADIYAFLEESLK